MRTAIVVFAFGLAVASAASAGSAVTDMDYLKANRCKGLAAGLGSGDTSGLDAMLKVEGRARGQAVVDRGDEEMAKAKREASRADGKERLTAELNGPCMAYMGAKASSTGSR